MLNASRLLAHYITIRFRIGQDLVDQADEVGSEER